MAIEQTTDSPPEKRKIEQKIADEGNIPTSSSMIGTALVLAAVVIGLGLIYLSVSVPASILAEAPPHTAKISP